MTWFALAVSGWSPWAFAQEPPPDAEISSGGPEVRADEVAPPDTDALVREIQALRQEVAALRGALPAEAPDPEAAPGDQPGRVGFGQPAVVQAGERVDEVVSFGSDVRVAGRVDGDAISFGGNVRIDETGRVDGDAVSFGGRVDVAEGAVLGGDRVALDMPIAPPIAVQVSDERAASGSLRLATDASQVMRSLTRRLVWMLSVAGAGVLVVGLFPQRVNRVASDIEARPVRAAVVGTMATGFLGLFASLFAVLTLGLGSPVSLVVFALLGLAWLLGFVGLCQVVGDRLPLHERPHGRWIAFLVGVVLLTFLGSLPWVGWFVVVGAGAVGIGSALSTRFGGATG